MATTQKTLQRLAIGLAAVTALPVWAFNSGSTGADGALNPAVSVEIALPPNGVLNYTSVNIPNGVTVTFKRNATNTPVVMLVQGNVTIAGVIDVIGKNAPDSGPVGDGVREDDGLPGIGGNGGFDGGAAGMATGAGIGGTGLGPGGGKGGRTPPVSNRHNGCGGPGSYGTEPAYRDDAPAGPIYGNEFIVPLIGGSGGGGGSPQDLRGSGGGGGGGAILIAAGATISVALTGTLLANGGSAGNTQNDIGLYVGAAGGPASGGAIRLIATSLSVAGTLSAAGGGRRSCLSIGGGLGRIRLEAETFGQLRTSNPPYTFGAPGSVFADGQPALRFVSIGGIAVPASPVGRNDISLPTNLPNPVAVSLATAGVPVGAVTSVTSTPDFGAAPTAVDSAPTTGTTANATAGVSIAIAPGHSVLSAQTSYTIVASLGDALSRFAQGERVERVTLSATLGGGVSHAVLTTTSGRQFDAPPAALALLASAR